MNSRSDLAWEFAWIVPLSLVLSASIIAVFALAVFKLQ
jgi:hypothetical protein